MSEAPASSSGEQNPQQSKVPLDEGDFLFTTLAKDSDLSDASNPSMPPLFAPLLSSNNPPATQEAASNCRIEEELDSPASPGNSLSVPRMAVTPRLNLSTHSLGLPTPEKDSAAQEKGATGPAACSTPAEEAINSSGASSLGLSPVTTAAQADRAVVLRTTTAATDKAGELLDLALPEFGVVGQQGLGRKLIQVLKTRFYIISHLESDVEDPEFDKNVDPILWRHLMSLISEDSNHDSVEDQEVPPQHS